MTKLEILNQFDNDCKLQGGSTEAISKAKAKALIEILCDIRTALYNISRNTERQIDVEEKVEASGNGGPTL